jgi:hypothetical protein
MRNFENYFKKEKWIKTLLLFGAVFLISFSSGAGSFRDVSRSVEKVKSIRVPFGFALIGDSRDGDVVYSQLIKRILERKPDFIIHLGDMVSNAHEREWEAFLEISKPITLPFFPVVGNHDVSTGSSGDKVYRKHFFLPGGKTYYAFRAGEVLFVALDSEKDRCRISKEQRSWLEDVLSSSKEKFRLVFIHRPLFPPWDSFKAGRSLDKYPLERDDLHRLFLRSKVKAVFEADDHRYDRSVEDGILYLISGGGGAPLSAIKESGGYFHYVWISVQKEKIEGEVVDLEGKVRDRFVIE